MRKTLILLALCLPIACATQPSTQVKTPSGAPEISIRAPKSFVVDQIAQRYGAGGWTIKTVNEYTVTVEKPAEGMAKSLLFGSRFNGTPNIRVTLNFGEVADLTRVRARIEAVTNPGSGFEKTTDLSSNAADLQKEFEQMKAQFEGGAIGIVPQTPSLILASVVAGGPADRAGIKAGDKLVKVAGQEVTNPAQAFPLLGGAPGSSVAIEVLRGGETLSFTVMRESFVQVFAKR